MSLPIVAIVALPPPTHGQAIVNQAVVDALSTEHAPLEIINVSPGSLRRGTGYHARRMSLFAFKAIPAISRAKGGLLYSVVEPGYGICYNFLTILASRIAKQRIVLHHHSALYTKAYDRRFDALARLAGRETVHVALDEFMARDLKARYSQIKNVVIAHNASHIAQPSVEQRNDRPLTCGFMSNLSREKGLDVFINCLRAARHAGLNVRAVLAGPPASSEAEVMVERAKEEFGNLLEVLGPVAASSKEAFFRSVDVFLFPTRYKVEGQPLVVLEAMSYGVPVIATEQGYCAELVGDAGAAASIAQFEVLAISFMRRCEVDLDYLRGMEAKARMRYQGLKREADLQLKALIELMYPAASAKPTN